MTADLFISYAKPDKWIADAICTRMESEGIRCRYEARDFRENDAASGKREAITSARAMVVIFTDASNVSEQVRDEVAEAIRAEVPVIPFKRTESVPTGSMKYYLSTLHWLDVVDRPLEDAITDLIQLYQAISTESAPRETVDLDRGRRSLPRHKSTYPERLRRRRQWIAGAAAAAILLILGIVVWSRGQMKPQPEETIPETETVIADPTPIVTEATASADAVSAKGTPVEIFDEKDETLVASYDNGSYLYSECTDGTIKLHRYHLFDQAQVTIPAVIDDKPVTVVGRSCFGTYDDDTNHHPEIISVTLPEGIRELGYMSFQNCSSLTEINFPSTLTTLGGYCLKNTAVVHVVVPDTVTTMKYGVFCQCEDLETVIVGRGVDSISYDTFRYDENLTSVILPSSIISIDKTAFDEDKNVVITGGPNTMADKYCTILQLPFTADESLGRGDLVIYRGEGSTDDYPPEAFLLTHLVHKGYQGEDWDNLYIDGYYGDDRKELIIPDTIGGIPVGGIQDEAFRENETLTKVVLPETVQNIGNSAFKHCHNLQEINMPRDLKGIGNAAFDNTALREVTIPSTVTYMSSMAFYGCDSLERVVIEDGVTSIRKDTFRMCASLSYIEIPASVTEIHVAALDASEKTVIYGKTGSYAEKYAKGVGIAFKEI